jgi:DNA-binding transcriptional ArsR family regulator
MHGFLFLQRQTGLTWVNLSSHLSKLEKAGYVAIEKEFIEKNSIGSTPHREGTNHFPRVSTEYEASV